MIALIGLGNVGEKFKDTKHNAGFWVVDEMANRHNVSFKPAQGDYVIASKPDKFFLIKPTTGMNRSGIAVKEIMDSKNMLINQIYIIFDDVDLPLGKIRIKPSGGDGCHKGMESIIYRLGTNKFPRIRFGIASGKNLRPSEKYVLKNFRENDQVLANEVIVRTSDAVESIVNNGLSKTMNQYNA